MFYWVCRHFPFCSHNQNRLYYCFLPHCLHGTVHLLKGIKPNQIFHWKFSLSIPPDHLRNRLLRDRKAFICTFPSKSVYEPAVYSAGGSIRFRDFWQNSKKSCVSGSVKSIVYSAAIVHDIFRHICSVFLHVHVFSFPTVYNFCCTKLPRQLQAIRYSVYRYDSSAACLFCRCNCSESHCSKSENNNRRTFFRF